MPKGTRFSAYCLLSVSPPLKLMLLKSLHYRKVFELKRERALKLTFPQYQSVDKMGETFRKGQSPRVQRYM